MKFQSYTAQVIDALGTLRFLDAIRETQLDTKFYQASTHLRLYGKVQEIPQSETTPFCPRSPYAVAKLYAYWITVNYREAYNIYASNGFYSTMNHREEKPSLARKITLVPASCVSNLENKKCFTCGNLDAKRDWGFAPEICWKECEGNVTTK